MRADLVAIRQGDRVVLADWPAHLPGVVLTLVLVSLSPLPLWAYLLACYAALAALKIRTFLEHRAHMHAGTRTVVVEDRGVLAFCFSTTISTWCIIHTPRCYDANCPRFIAARRRGIWRAMRAMSTAPTGRFLRATCGGSRILWRIRSGKARANRPQRRA